METISVDNRELQIYVTSPGSDSLMNDMGMLRLDHVGVVVDDLDAVAAFFLDLGFEREGGRWSKTSGWTRSTGSTASEQKW